jgi:hypothetical protein
MSGAPGMLACKLSSPPCRAASEGRGLIGHALMPHEPAQLPRPPAGFLRPAKTMCVATLRRPPSVRGIILPWRVFVLGLASLSRNS